MITSVALLLFGFYASLVSIFFMFNKHRWKFIGVTSVIFLCVALIADGSGML